MGKKYLEPELREMSEQEILEECTCDIRVPGPVIVYPDCPVHWDLASNSEPTVLGQKKIEAKA